MVGRKLATLLRVGPRRQALIAEAVFSLLAARLAVRAHRFENVSQRLGTFVPADDPRLIARRPASARHLRLARDIGWAVTATAPFVPFRSVCLQQALAAHAMLKRRGVPSVMHLGAGKGSAAPIDAHAWLEAGGVKVTGYPIAANLAELGCFI